MLKHKNLIEDHSKEFVTQFYKYVKLGYNVFIENSLRSIEKLRMEHEEVKIGLTKETKEEMKCV